MTDTTRSARSEEIWILGASGRIGSAVTADLAARGLTPVLVGRAADGDLRMAVAQRRRDSGLKRHEPAPATSSVGARCGVWITTARPGTDACQGGTQSDSAGQRHPPPNGRPPGRAGVVLSRSGQTLVTAVAG